MSGRATILTLLLICWVDQAILAAEFSADGSHATLEALPPQPENALGYPDNSPLLDVLPGFQSPPEGYGEVPFYWWVGGPLTKEQLSWQLDQLDQVGVQGFSVSYPHSHSDIDVELNKNGFGRWGLTYPSDPPVFSDDWWALWDWFSGECAKRDMGVGLDDYTFCTPGNHQWPDDIAGLPKMKAYQGKLSFTDQEAKGGEPLHMEIPATVLSVTGRQAGQSLDLLPEVHERVLEWTPPAGGDWHVSVVSTTSGFMLHPEHGQEVIARYFQNFENHLSPEHRKGQNFFFQDELLVDMDVGVWSEDFAEIFKREKGYDIQPFLAALKCDMGDQTVKVRLDYWDVAVSLAEERYFKPIFDWHWKRGLIYGCDNEGRGLHPTIYGDYFRAMRWYTAPGNDAPMGATSLVQTKVNSSIAHLYQRPRVWLEAFHSMGWDSKTAQIHEGTETHFLLGGNLLCLHGLYYTTYGGFWEWAPPDFHFRMPYWPHMKGWFKYVERLSYLLSQGHHVADVAVVYPAAPLQAGNGGTTKPAWKAAQVLFDAGLDFDFIDHQSLARAEIADGEIRVAGEGYRVLVLADMTAVHSSTIEQAKAFKEAGGQVLSIGRLPQASDKNGANDPELDALVQKIFPEEAVLGDKIEQIPDAVSRAITRDFLPENHKGHVLHRRVGSRDVYMVMNVPQGEECFFRALGKAELWNPWTGETAPLPVERQTAKGSVVRIPNKPPASSIIVFSPGEPIPAPPASSLAETILPIDGEWESELVPTMSNQWGDFRQPPSNEYIGAEAREFRYAPAIQAGEDWMLPGYDDSSWQVVRNSFGPQMQVLHLPPEADPQQTAKGLLNPESGKDAAWRPHSFSWRWGVQDQPGSQGYHGLKERVSDDFLIMGEAGHYFFRTQVVAPGDLTACIEISGREPDALWLDGQPLSQRTVPLGKGPHDLLVAYYNIPKGKLQYDFMAVDQRTRSAVVFFKGNAGEAEPYPLSMRWYRRPGRLPYVPYSNDSGNECYRFTAAPGLKAFSFKAEGTAEVWVDGKKAPVRNENGALEVSLSSPCLHPAIVAIKVSPHLGAYAGAAFPEPIKLTCGPGIITEGDWSQIGVMKHYSGGLWYRKNLSLTAEQTQGQVTLDLGQVTASAEVWINGKQAGVCITDPFTLDVTGLLKEGENRLEILVYNTLSNHYQTIPTPQKYKKTTTSGLLGPVRLIQQH